MAQGLSPFEIASVAAYLSPRNGAALRGTRAMDRSARGAFGGCVQLAASGSGGRLAR
jgi:hypothetical protein